MPKGVEHGSPLHFVPYLRPMVWGGRRLAEVLHRSLPSEDVYGESWEISDHPSHRSRVAQGSLAGRTLRELMEEGRTALLGIRADAHATFPLLIKLLDANDWLSVQVHPDDWKVQTLWPGERGKTEVWFVLDAAPESRVYAGLKPDVDEESLRQALAAGVVADCLHSFTPRPGDCLFLPAGTVHAVGGGVLMAEVQQTSDATFRLFDWNRRDAQGRSRPLHIEQALSCIDWQRGPITPIRVAGYDDPPGGKTERHRLVSCPYFTLDYWRSGEPFCCEGKGQMQILMVIQGQGRLVTPWGEEVMQVGDTWLLPASLSLACCRPDPGMSVLLSSLPA